jgi:hypothetical protein
MRVNGGARFRRDIGLAWASGVPRCSERPRDARRSARRKRFHPLTAPVRRCRRSWSGQRASRHSIAPPADRTKGVAREVPISRDRPRVAARSRRRVGDRARRWPAGPRRWRWRAVRRARHRPRRRIRPGARSVQRRRPAITAAGCADRLIADAGSWACPAGLAGGRDSGLAVRRR